MGIGKLEFKIGNKISDFLLELMELTSKMMTKIIKKIKTRIPKNTILTFCQSWAMRNWKIIGRIMLTIGLRIGRKNGGNFSRIFWIFGSIWELIFWTVLARIWNGDCINWIKFWFENLENWTLENKKLFKIGKKSQNKKLVFDKLQSKI